VASLTTRFGDLDLAFSPSGFSTGFDALRLAATTMTIDVSVFVASLDDVITWAEPAQGNKDGQRQEHHVDRNIHWLRAVGRELRPRPPLREPNQSPRTERGLGRRA
jgi:hypothetical protein